MKTYEFAGTWHIYEMNMWDEEYFNMEVHAYVKVETNTRGEFQFGLVCGSMDGKITNHPEGKRFEFTWEGSDECDDASGSGWLRMKCADEIEGEIRIHGGGSTAFGARRVNEKKKKKREKDRNKCG